MQIPRTHHQRFTLVSLMRGQKPEMSLQVIHELHFKEYYKNPASLIGQMIPHRGDTYYWFLRDMIRFSAAATRMSCTREPPGLQ